jgi:hypothetical protein
MSEKEKINYWEELKLTFTTRKSLLSSKKIERFVVFVVFLILTIVFIGINIRKLSALEFVELTALWLVYGGYNTLMNLRDKKLNKEQNEQES